MLKNLMLLIIVLFFLNGCTSKDDEKKIASSDGFQTVELTHRNAVKEIILKSISEPESYKDISWEKMQSSDKVTQRIGKNALFIQHTFSSKNIFKGTLTQSFIYFIGDSQPSLIIDFDMKIVFAEFLSNKSIGDLFPKSLWDFEKLHITYQKSLSDKTYQDEIKDFIYAMKYFNKEEAKILIDSISNANTPLSRAKNLSIFLTMRVFPELMEELLYNEITYNGKYK